MPDYGVSQSVSSNPMAVKRPALGLPEPPRVWVPCRPASAGPSVFAQGLVNAASRGGAAIAPARHRRRVRRARRVRTGRAGRCGRQDRTYAVWLVPLAAVCLRRRSMAHTVVTDATGRGTYLKSTHSSLPGTKTVEKRVDRLANPAPATTLKP